MQRIVVASLLCLACLGAQAAERVRVVLDSGWVVPLSGDGSALAGEPVKLDLPEQSRGIYAFAPDYVYNRLYVTPQLSYGARGTVVFELSSLKRLGFMPGVTEVKVPRDRKAPWLVTRTLLDADAAPDGPSSVEYLRHEIATAVSVETRSRESWNQVALRQAEQDLAFDADVLWQCYSPRDKAFLQRAPYRVFGADLTQKKLAGTASPAQSLADGRILDCWGNGDALLAQWMDETVSVLQSTSPGFVARRSAAGEIVRIQPDAPIRLTGSRAVLVALGSDGRYAGYLRGGQSFVLFDFAKKTAARLPLIGNPRFGQYSADQNEWYLPSAYYEYRGATELEYIEGMSGGPSFGDSLYRVRVGAGDSVKVDKLKFPREIGEIGERAARLREIAQREGLSEQDRQDMLAELPPLGKLGQLVGSFDVVGALAD